MPDPAPTVRTLALKLGLSRATVSNALRGVGRISPDTVKRVRQAAKEAGYRYNPLAGTLLSALRRSQGHTVRGVLAAVDVAEPERPPHGPFHTELLKGARERAAELGFKLETFIVGRDGLTAARLDSILQARGIHGVMLFPSWHRPDWSGLDWTRYAGVYTDYLIQQPALSCVTTDPYKSIVDTLARLAARGYRRPGLFIERERDERTQWRFCAPFVAMQTVAPGIEAVPPLLVTERNAAEFSAWFKRHKPDVVLSHFTETIAWMEACGARVPQTHGFVGLNVLLRERACAALDLQPRVIGARSVELVIAQIQRHELGVPEWPTLTTVSARWIDGPTLRKA